MRRADQIAPAALRWRWRWRWRGGCSAIERPSGGHRAAIGRLRGAHCAGSPADRRALARTTMGAGQPGCPRVASRAHYRRQDYPARRRLTFGLRLMGFVSCQRASAGRRAIIDLRAPARAPHRPPGRFRKGSARERRRPLIDLRRRRAGRNESAPGGAAASLARPHDLQINKRLVAGWPAGRSAPFAHPSGRRAGRSAEIQFGIGLPLVKLTRTGREYPISVAGSSVRRPCGGFACAAAAALVIIIILRPTAQ